MTGLPKRVRVGQKNLTVIRRPMRKLFGRTYLTHRRGKEKILVDSSLTGLPALSTLVHEMLHQLDWRLSERRIQQMEYAVVSMILSNPKVVKALADHAPPPIRTRPSRKT